MHALLLALMLTAVFVGSSLAQTHAVCGFARAPAPNLVLAGDTAGNLFIGDQPNGTVLKVTPTGATSIFVTGLGAFHDIAVDRNGNLFIAEANPPRIRKVTAAGVISIFAGNGAMGKGGDGGPATAASLCPPVRVAADAAGNVFINFGISGADSLEGDYRIRKVSIDGIINTFAGGGLVYTSGRGPSTIVTIPDGGLATSKPLLTTGLAAGDNGNNLFVVNAPFVRKVTPGGIITTVAGNGPRASGGDGGPAIAAPLTPSSVAVDGAGNLYIVDGNNRIRRVNPAGIISTIAGTGARGGGILGTEGPAISAELAFITDMTADGTGNIFIAETTGGQLPGASWTRRVRKISSAGVISTIYTKTEP